MGGIFGGLELAAEWRQAHKPDPGALSGPNGSLVVLPWQAAGNSLVFDPVHDGAPASDGVAVSCNDWSPLAANDPMRSITFSPAGLNQSVATYLLGQNATQVFLHAMGDSTTGMISVIGQEDQRLLSEAAVPTGMMRVDVIMRYNAANSTQQSALVCEMMKPDGSVGVGVYTASYATRSPQEVVAPNPDLSFVVLVRFPSVNTSDDDAAAASKPANVTAFNMTTDSMSLRMGNMQGIAEFQSMSTSFGRGGISVDYVSVDSLMLATQTSTISGSFNISRSLVLNTTNGGIMADVALRNPNIGWNPFPSAPSTFASNPTRRGGIPTTPPANGTYDPGLARYLSNVTVQPISVSAVTTNGPLFLTYTSQDPGIRLDSTVSTTNGDANVRMHPSYEGSFLVRSVNGDMQIPDANDFSSGTSFDVDPWGQGRSRAIIFSSGSNEAWAANLTSGLASDPTLGNVRGNAVFDAEDQSWNVRGVTLWLDPEEIASNINVTQTALTLADSCVNATTCAGANFTRTSVSKTITSWGGAQLGFS